MVDTSVGSRLVALTLSILVVLAVLWLAARLLDVVLGPFTPLLSAAIVAAAVLLLLDRSTE
jgi:4-amino-4-deoxy-L-arabinose transferase-like glycosyltransferase